MKTIKITTQQEFDSLPLSFDEFTEINIFSVNNINISKNISNSQVTARENSQVTARGNSQVTARGNSQVTAWGNSQVTARENSQVTAWENSQVTACGNSQVTAWENSQVTAWGNVCVHTYSNNSILLFGLSVAFLLSSSSKAIKKSKKSTIIKGIIKDGKVKNWIELEGLEIKNKSVILFKKVSKDFLTQENTPNETKWEIGKTKTITHPNWQPDKEECGNGKFHACSLPVFCDEFRSDKDDKYVAIEIKVKDLYAWPNPDYPHKIAFREGVVLYECDSKGRKS